VRGEADSKRAPFPAFGKLPMSLISCILPLIPKRTHMLLSSLKAINQVGGQLFLCISL
jgi:hypothetical protein